MSLQNKGTVIALDEETVIGGGQSGTWVATDVVGFNDDSGLTPATSVLERNTFNNSFIMCQSLAGIDSTSGNLNLDLAVKPVVGTEAGKLNGHLIYKVGLGKYVEQGANVDTVTFKIKEEVDPVANPTGYDLYTLSKPDEPRGTLVVREFLGGSGDAVLDHKGVVVESLAFDFTAGNIVKVTNSVSGVGYGTATGQTVLPSTGCEGIPFVTKNAVLKLDGATLDASNVSLTVTNTIVDRSYITGTGISDKVVVAKAIELSYTVDLDATQMAFYSKMKQNTTGEIYISLVTTSGDKCAIYLPKVNFTNVTKSNDGGLLTLSIASSGFEGSSGDALLIGVKKA